MRWRLYLSTLYNSAACCRTLRCFTSVRDAVIASRVVLSSCLSRQRSLHNKHCLKPHCVKLQVHLLRQRRENCLSLSVAFSGSVDEPSLSFDSLLAHNNYLPLIPYVIHLMSSWLDFGLLYKILVLPSVAIVTQYL